MAPRPRRVVRAEGFVVRAQHYFPPGGSSDGGRPSFELFEERILSKLEYLAAHDFERWSGATDSDPIRFYVVGAAGPFPPMTIYAALVGDERTVEFIDIDVDTDYWDLIAGDPSD
jgi:hypothetical protein